MDFWQVEDRVMEAINIPWLHVDTYLFFHMWVGQGVLHCPSVERERGGLAEGV